MRRIFLAVVAFAVMVAVCSCSKDTSTSPEEVVEEVPLAVDTLDAAGGTLEIDDFALTVPPGAFDSPAEIKLYESREDHGFGDNSVSRFFRLEGIPENFSDSLSVRIQYQGTLTGESYIAVGTDEEVSIDGIEQAEGTVYSLLPALEISGYLESRLPPREVGLLSKPGESRGATMGTTSFVGRFVAITGYDALNSEHIKLRYPPDLAHYAGELLTTLEAAHDSVVSIGIGYSGRLWDWPVVAVVKDPNPLCGYCIVFTPDKKTPSIIIDKNRMNETDLLRFQYHAAMSMMLIAQKSPSPDDYVEPGNVWWHKGVTLWSGIEFGGAHAPSRPKLLAGNEMKALEGLPVGLNNYYLAIKHGYAWTAIVEYLTRRYGNDILGTIYERIRGGQRPAMALLKSLPEPEYNWWPHFADQYLNGNIYEVETAMLLVRVVDSDRFMIKTAEDILWNAEKNYNQLSAHLHRIIPECTLIDESAALELSISYAGVDPDYISLLVYKEKDGVLEFVNEGNTVHVKDLKDLTIYGYEILAVVVNSFTEEPYTEKPKINLTARVTKQPYNWCSISIGLLSAQFTTDEDSTFWDEEWAIRWEGEGTFSGNTFTASWSGRPEPGGEVSTGELTVVLDPATLDVTSFSAQEIYTDALGYQSVDRVSGGDIAFYEITSLPNPYLCCKVLGESTCSKISNLEYKLTHLDSGKWEELDQIICGTEAAIYVTFWYWEGE